MNFFVDFVVETHVAVVVNFNLYSFQMDWNSFWVTFSHICFELIFNENCCMQIFACILVLRSIIIANCLDTKQQQQQQSSYIRTKNDFNMATYFFLWFFLLLKKKLLCPNHKFAPFCVQKLYCELRHYWPEAVSLVPYILVVVWMSSLGRNYFVVKYFSSENCRL